MLKKPDKQSGGLGQAFLEALATVPLHAVDSRPHRKLPRGPGEKKLRLEGPGEEEGEEEERLKGYLSEQLVAQSAQRITTQKSISTATWEPTTHLAIVTSQKGSHWSTHGHTHSGQLVLLPHEALFLMEMGCLELETGGLPMTLQQAYHTFIGENLPLQEYMVIASLKRRGYVVRRSCIGTPISDAVPETTPTNSSEEGALQSLPSCSLCDPKPQPVPNQCVCLLEVYRPRGGSFKKSDPSPPQFRVFVISPLDPFPSPSLLKRLSLVRPSSLEPLRCCVVDGASLTYYTVTQGLLPPPPP